MFQGPVKSQSAYPVGLGGEGRRGGEERGGGGEEGRGRGKGEVQSTHTKRASLSLTQLKVSNQMWSVVKELKSLLH